MGIGEGDIPVHTDTLNFTDLCDTDDLDDSD
jgi:hypothetical protein